LVGMKRAAYFLMTGDSIDARQAESFGMINFVTPDESVLPDAIKLDTAFGIYNTSYDVKDRQLTFKRSLLQNAFEGAPPSA